VGSAVDQPAREGDPPRGGDIGALRERCLAGDQAAWSAMVDLFSRLVYSVPRRAGLNAADSEDVFQKVFLALYKRLDSIDDPAALPKWLATTAQRESWKIPSARRSSTEADALLAASVAPEPAADDLERWERQHTIRAALDALGGRCERLLKALFLDRPAASYSEVSERLGIPAGAIGPTRARCFRKLVDILESWGRLGDFQSL
jgi:RNA polymerase sigma factor (sigma-70 family)